MLKRIIVLYAQDALAEDGGARAGEAAVTPALDELSRRGTSGVLVLRGSRQAGGGFPTALEQVRQVLGNESGDGDSAAFSLAAAYKGAECHLLSNCESTRSGLGPAFSRVDALASGSGSGSGSGSPEDLVQELESKLASALSPSDGEGEGQRQQPDMIFVHLLLGSRGGMRLGTLDAAAKMVADKFVDPAVTLVVLAGGRPGVDLTAGGGGQGSPRLVVGSRSVPIPRQSFEFSGGKLVEDWCNEGHLLCVHFSPRNNVRVDLCRSFSLSEAREKGGNGATLATHFMKGCMYSLLKAPKYGS